ncbi:BglG family transcription antiterminator LicT [Brachyspira intermedia]|uniref:BglG family transcription antiterminator LicT n=1 Tax=Brachyspira intermedia TaxID=84377 RepID=UPI0030074B2A
MIIKKILNNNVVTSTSENGQEIIVVGNGIGWKQKVGQEIEDSKIEKIFRMDTASSTAKLKQLFIEVKIESINASTEIIEYAKKNLNKDLNKNIYITLTDHIDFAIERFERGIEFKNALYWEIRKIYKKEFEIGQYALNIIEKHFGVRLPEEEAAAIATYIINAEFDGNMSHTESMIRIVKKAINVVSLFVGKQLDEDSLDYQRFVTHLLFFAQRVIEQKFLEVKSDCLVDTIKKEYPQEYKCARKIADFVSREYDIEIGDEETTFLAVHIIRVMS